jgi:hypothetical protein
MTISTDSIEMDDIMWLDRKSIRYVSHVNTTSF